MHSFSILHSFFKRYEKYQLYRSSTNIEMYAVNTGIFNQTISNNFLHFNLHTKIHILFQNVCIMSSTI